MKNFIYLCLTWFLLVSNIGFSQQNVQEHSFFEPGTQSARQDYSSAVEDGVILEFSPDLAKAFARKAPQTFEMDLPVGTSGERLTLKLEKANIFAEGFKVVGSDNPDKALDIDLGLHYHGVVEGEANTVVAISVHDDYICGLIRTSKGNYTLGKLENASTGHIVYLDSSLRHTRGFECDTEDDDFIYPREMLTDNRNNRDAGDCIRVYVEVGDDVTTNAGSAGAASTFAIDLFNQSFSLYASEMINMTISSMLVWTAPDPYVGPFAFQYVSQFQANTNLLIADLGHLLVFDSNVGGRAARINGLCHPDIDQRLCFSSINSTSVQNVPTYSWNVDVVSHEMGHLLGARHTHACVWNGNGTQIDDCGNQWVLVDGLDNDFDFMIDEPDEASTAEGAACFVPASPIFPADKGTIMSYCHLFNDIKKNLVFDPQVGNVMRNVVANAVCLNADCEYCSMTLDCSNIPLIQFITCPDEIPPPDEDLVIITSACSWPVTITVTDEGTGIFLDPLIRTYTATDATGFEASCMQYFFGNSNLAVTNIFPGDCILDDFTITGTYIECPPITVTSIELEFKQNGVSSGVIVPVSINPDGTWIFSSTVFAMVAEGLEFGNGYDVFATMTLSDGSERFSPSYNFTTNDDVNFAQQSDPQVILNEAEDDLTTSQLTFCEGSPIFYHGIDPLSDNHFVSITRRQIGSPGGYTDYRKYGEPMGNGWVEESLDGFTADLQDYFPPDPDFDPEEYFVAGYEYKLQIASSNLPECITWSPLYIEFRVVDCCAPEFELSNVPECVVDGEVFTLTVTLDAPLEESDVQIVYSYNNDYTVVDYETVVNEEKLDLIVYFVSNGCTCAGNMFIFDIGLRGCPVPVWVMTHEIPCCDSNCESFQIVDWNADPDCIIVNGLISHEFCIQVANDVPVVAVFPTSNDATCQVELSNLEITSAGDGLYDICGYMSFLDPECVGWTYITMIVETENGCCSIQQGFSFPEGCNMEEACIGGDPEIQVIYSGYMTVSLNLPLGQTVFITDHITGGIQATQVETISCGPFEVSQGGVVSGGTECNGIKISTPLSLNCHKMEGEVPYIPYHFEITWGNCVWVLIGNYCDELIAVQSFQDGEPEHRIEESSVKADTPSGQMLIFPNPLTGSDVLNFDVSNLHQGIENIQIRDLQGRPVESFVPDNAQQLFSHRLAKPLPPGVYFIKVKLQDGSVNNTKLISVK